MTLGEGNGGDFDPFQPTADSIIHDMLSHAIGPDTPMTAEARETGLVEVQARLARAKEIYEGAVLDPDEDYDSEAVAALVLMSEEEEARQEAATKRREIIDGFPESAADYLNFLNMELAETFGAFHFSMHFAAPGDMTTEQVELIAEDLRTVGWNADVAPIDPEDAESPIGIRVVSEEQ